MRRIENLFIAFVVIGFVALLAVANLSDGDYITAGQAFTYGILSTALMIIGVGGYRIVTAPEK